MTAAVEAAEHLAEAAEAAAAVESVAIAVVVALNHNNLWFLPNHLPYMRHHNLLLIRNLS